VNYQNIELHLQEQLKNYDMRMMKGNFYKWYQIRMIHPSDKQIEKAISMCLLLRNKE
jgi:hypothetical protein